MGYYFLLKFPFCRFVLFSCEKVFSEKHTKVSALKRGTKGVSPWKTGKREGEGRRKKFKSSKKLSTIFRLRTYVFHNSTKIDAISRIFSCKLSTVRRFLWITFSPLKIPSVPFPENKKDPASATCKSRIWCNQRDSNPQPSVP